MAVITISRQFGSGGDEVAARLCEVLSYRSFGKAQILDAAQQTNLSKTNAIDYTEDNHEVQTFLTRLRGQAASPVQKIAWSENPSIASRPERADVTDTAVLSLVKRAVQSALRDGNTVIVGRGGQVLLKDAPGVLHVRIEAPLEARAVRVMEQMKLEPGSLRGESELQRAAQELIAIRDKASADYVQRFYHADWADSGLYHLVLNLGRLGVDQAVQIVVTAVQGMSG